MGDLKDETYDGLTIAVVGMAGRFPGAQDLDEYWKNLRSGVESISSFTDEELKAQGVSPEELASERYVRSAPVLQDVERFDADLFDYSPGEARLMDPQQRLLLECAWEALEHAGHDPARHPEPIAVFAGARTSTYLFHVLANRASLSPADRTLVELGNDVSSVATRISYKLDLTGPSYTVQTACSTSLAVIHLACQSLMLGECRMALAAAAAINVPHRAGYLHERGGILSPDGRCRPFDADAQGTVFGSGVGAIVLKRLADALTDGDRVLAVVRGTATNNDGAHKASYTAPSVEGQTDVILEALACAGVEVDSISYLEAHGTATALGDPIEILALTNAYRAATDKKGFCRIGSVKSNFGHLDAASGMAGFIKTVLAMQHRQVPPSLHFSRPNPHIDFASSPFEVTTRLTPWTGPSPLRAGVSSFGFGGTNAHVILEEAPPAELSGAARPWQMLTLSARSAPALENATTRLATYLQEHPEVSLADVAYTLHVGRRGLEHRRVLVCQTVAEGAAALTTRAPDRLLTGVREGGERPVVFLFPGQSSPRVNVARGLHASEPLFREQIDRCAELLRPHLGLDLRAALYPEPASADEAARALDQASLAQPALFAIELALSKLWSAWGIEPEAMIGDGLGELVAACLAGVFSVEDALMLASMRGRLMQECGGETMEPVVATFTEVVRRVVRKAAKIPYVSGVTGGFVTPEQATDARSWAERLLQPPAQLARGLEELLKDPTRILLEVGPGETLASLARKQPAAAGRRVLSSMLGPDQKGSDEAALLASLGHLWMAGLPVDWKGFYARERRRRVELPAYPFDRKRFWVDPPQGASSASVLEALSGYRHKRRALADWFYLPGWKQTMAPASRAAISPERWLVFGDASGLGARLSERLSQEGHDVITVTAGARRAWTSKQACTIDPRRQEDYAALLQELAAADRYPQGVAHLWSALPSRTPRSDRDLFDEHQSLGFYSLLFLAQGLGERAKAEALQLAVITTELQEVESSDAPDPDKATALGPCRVIPREYPHITARNIDVVLPPPGTPREAELVAQLAAELRKPDAGETVAYRGRSRWVQDFEPIRVEEPADPLGRLRSRGRYLITGGLGSIGLSLADFLARKAQARLALVGRSAFPAPQAWDQWLSTHAAEDAVSVKIRKLMELVDAGAEIHVASADVADLDQMRSVLDQVRARWGGLDGVIHAAGVAGGGLIQGKTPEAAFQVMAPKIQGARVLDALLRDTPLDFWVLFSSITSFVGEMGQVDYCAANAYLDAFARSIARRGSPAVAINWDMWRSAGMAVDAQLPAALKALREVQLELAIRPEEGVEALRRVLSGCTSPAVVVSTTHLPELLEQVRAFAQHNLLQQLGELADGGASAHARPALRTPYVAPRTDVEQAVARVWQQVLRFEQVGVNDSFFDLGGHSLLAAQLRNRIQAALKVDVPLRGLFDAPTIAGIAAWIEEERLRVSAAPDRPIAERLRAAFPTERQGILEEYLKRAIARGLRRAPSELPADGSLAGLDLHLLGAELEYDMKQDFKFQLFPHEILGRSSIADLGRYLLAEMDRLTDLSRFASHKPLSAYPLRPYREPAAARARAPEATRKSRGMAFVHSSPRAGSTLFRIMLAGHPQLFCPPEVNLLFFEDAQAWRRNIGFGHPMEWTTGGLQWAFMELLGLESEAGRALIDDLVAQNASVQAIYGRLQELASPRLLVDKTPSYSLDLATLERAEALFDEPKYIYLFRHPYPVMDSILRVRMDRLFGPSLFGAADVDPYVVAETVWALSNRNLLDFFDRVPRERCHWVRYEDLVRDPGAVMNGVCAFLGIPFDEQVLKPYDGKRERMMGGLGDPNILLHDRIEPDLGEAWKRIQWPRRLDSSTRALVAKLGYEVTEPAPPRQPEARTPPTSAEAAEQLLANLDELPDDQVAALLAELSAATTEKV